MSDLENESPDGDPDSENPENNEEEQPEPSIVTERSLDRELEDIKYMSVIIKRNDEVVRHPDDTLEKTIHEGLEQLNRSSVSLFLSSISAGFLVGFSAMAVAVVTQLTSSADSKLVTRIACALVYPLGFVICILSGSQLFTEHTATAVYPILDRKAKFPKLFKLWGIVICGNLLGCFIISILFYMSNDVIHAREGFLLVGKHLVEFRSLPLLISAILAGCLMAEGAWLIISSPPDISQMASVYIVTFLIGVGGFHHSIAGSAEMFSAYLMSDQFTIGESFRFIFLALLGNLIGGSLFVSVLNYAHIRKTQSMEEEK